MESTLGRRAPVADRRQPAVGCTMIATMRSTYGNRQKHESRNPLQQALLGRFKAEVVRIVRAVRPRTLLEVGCGEGYMLEVIAEAGLGVSLHGVDVSTRAIEDARERLGGQARLEVLDARDLARAGETYDLVLMLEVLEHLERPADMLPILASLTGEHVLLSVPWEPIFRGLNFLRGKHVRALGNDPEHVQHWGRAGFLRFVETRFDVLEAPFVFPWTMALARRRARDAS
ncbi:MAG: class I SAM-dependent methyltransferase [Sandaracinaceae bacterium]